jgi:predicted RNase H-like HicB family nuclease
LYLVINEKEVVIVMVHSKKVIYPAFIKQDDEGMYGVYFPTLFPDSSEAGWDFPKSEAETKSEALEKAKKDLAFTLALVLNSNEELPEPVPIPVNQLTKEMEAIEIETSIDQYSDEIKEYIKGHHWHLDYYVEEYNENIEAIGYKNDEGKWDILFEDFSEEEEAQFFDSSYKGSPKYPGSIILFSVDFRSEAEEKFNQFVENIILKKRTTEEWEDRKEYRIQSQESFYYEYVFPILDEKVKNGELTEEEVALMKEAYKNGELL